MGTPRWTIYCHTHTETGRRYIGLTKKTMVQRWNQHVFNAKSKNGYGCFHFWNAIRKYGKDAFSHHLLEFGIPTLEIANEREEYWIVFYDSRNPEKGFNLARCGEHRPHGIRKNPWDDPEFRSRNLSRLDEIRQTPQEAKTDSLSMWEDPILRGKHKLTAKSTWESEEYRKKRDKLWQDPDFRSRSLTGIKRGIQKQKDKTHCPHNHEYTPENTFLVHGGRACKTCRTDRQRARRQRAREQVTL